MKKLIAVILCIIYAYIFYGSLNIFVNSEAAIELATRSFTTGFFSILLLIGYFVGFIILFWKTLGWAEITPEE